MRRVAAVVLAWTLIVAIPLRAVDASLDAAITLYMSASYEEALVELARVAPGDDLDQADKYRALCLLGLNRPQEAQAAIERLVMRRPLLKVDEKDSPKLVLMYREAQSRLLPGAAKALYTTAKEHFEHGEIAASVEEFRQVLAVIAEVGEAGQTSLVDLKMLAEGFSNLADRQLAAVRSPATPPVRPAQVEGAPPSRAPTASSETRSTRIFDSTDPDVTPPLAIAQAMPVWTPRADVERRRYSGTLEIVIDENGTVSSAVLTEPVYPSYDQQLLQAVKGWRYKPAQRAGQPVKYRRGLSIVLAPPPG
jgi:TonB family protein